MKLAGAVAVIGFAAVIVILVISALLKGSVPVSGSVDSISAIDVANLSVTATFTNEGDKPTKIECTVEARDAGDFVVGFDIFTTVDEIAPHESKTASGAIRIEDEGAFRVVRAVARDCKSV